MSNNRDAWSAAILKKATRSKYGAKKKIVDNLTFDSTAEAKRYVELKALAQAGEITHLCVQPHFNLFAAGPTDGGVTAIVLVGVYVADFQYRDQTSRPLAGMTVVEDVKSQATRTPLYKLKKKLAEACHWIEIREV